MNLDNTFKFKRRILIMNNNRNQCPAGSNPYTIRAGDTFFMLAKSHNVSVDELLKANPGVDPDRLFIGQNICIPSSTSTPPSSSNVLLLEWVAKVLMFADYKDFYVKKGLILVL